ncbi:MAG: radical SAM protein [Bacillota bacterium]
MVLTRLVRQERKAPVLKTPAFGCFKGVPAINVTRGCPHACVYCYARGFPDAPPKSEVHLYTNLPAKLEKELAHKRKWPRWVSFSTASDPFPPVDEVLEVTYRVMALLLARGIGVTFLTKGFIPPDFIALFKRYNTLVKARIGLVSASEDYQRVFEPFTAHPLKRLMNIRNLAGAGIETSVRMDPLLPGVADAAEAVEHLLKRLKAAGVKEVTVSALVLRPTVANQLAAELPAGFARAILGYYREQPWRQVITSAKTKLLPLVTRMTQYQTIKEVARRYGLDCRICGCKNPDLPWESCNPEAEEDQGKNKKRRVAQGNLFELIATTRGSSTYDSGIIWGIKRPDYCNKNSTTYRTAK